MTNEELEVRLKSMAEPEYLKFSGGLMPSDAAQTMLGVRLPALRQLAKELAGGDWRKFLRDGPENFLEETMVKGMTIGCAKAEPEEKLKYIQWFVPKITSWSVCDSFCAGLKFTKKCPEMVWQFLQPYLRDTREFYARFGLVMLLDYFSREPYIKEALRRIDAVQADGFYAQMAAAWAVSVCYVHEPQVTMDYLQHSSLKDATFNKSLQKITESRRVSPEEKAVIRRMRR
ncbi:MAG: DNA alkylation repair protein [Oscillospiraceae bacterium]|jgi:3-methyladenine DNA glycosylase AlkD|nr:DNA alkylation repair protein [Oscillospiraceae bacterium]